MALISADSTCALCDGALDRPFTATSGCAFGSDHFLVRYCDAPLHYDCLEAWPHRQEFSRAYFDRSLKAHREGRAGTLLEVRDSWFLSCGPVTDDQRLLQLLEIEPGEPYCADVRLADWPVILSSRWREWDVYVAVDFRVDLVGAALDAAVEVMSEVRAVAPTLPVLSALRARRIAEGTAGRYSL